jgi:hypothetical protein
MTPAVRAALAVRCSTCQHATTDRRTCTVSGLTLTAHINGEPCPRGIAPGVVSAGMPPPAPVAPDYRTLDDAVLRLVPLRLAECRECDEFSTLSAGGDMVHCDAVCGTCSGKVVRLATGSCPRGKWPTGR